MRFVTPAHRTIHGHVLDVLAGLPDNRFQAVITSPPYYGLRSYSTSPQIWGGSEKLDCTGVGKQHLWDSSGTTKGISGGVKSPKVGIKGVENFQVVPDREYAFCTRCGAWRGELGGEPNPDLYVKHLTEVFSGVKRVLRPDGLLFLNLGDSYSAGTNGGLPAKNMIGIPWRVAFALQADGWILRNAVIWRKVNAMPTSVKDRFSPSYEFVFMFSKRPKYYFDMDAVREEAQSNNNKLRDKRTGKYAIIGNRNASTRRAGDGLDGKRQKRDVWDITTKGFKGAHFATFPPELVETCIRAATSEEGACRSCGAPYVRIVRRGEPDREWQRLSGGDADGEYRGTGRKDYAAAKVQNPSDVKRRILESQRARLTEGWESTCGCSTAEIIPCEVLDPFSGAATVATVAKQLGRRSVGIELNPEYVEMGKARLRGSKVSGTGTKQSDLGDRTKAGFNKRWRG